MRLSINKTHDQYLQAIASQMGTSPQNAIDFMLWKLRESNYNFGGHLPQEQRFEPAMNGIETFQPRSPQAIQEFEQLAEEIDPVIEKFISLGLVDQF